MKNPNVLWCRVCALISFLTFESLSLAASRLPELPLSTSGRYIVDASGSRYKLASANWFGAYDIHNVVDGLHKAPMQEISNAIAEMGFNSVRLPFSNEMLWIDQPVSSRIDFSLNPELLGLTPIEVFDRTIDSLGKAGSYGNSE